MSKVLIKKTLISPQLIVRAPQRTTSDVGTWRNALKSADTGMTKRLFELYEDLLIDGVLSDAQSKRVEAVTNSELIFVDKKGEKVQVINDLIDTIEFEELIKGILDSIYWGRSAMEFSFVDGLKINHIPKAHISLETQSILLNDTDSRGISYINDDFLLVLGRLRQWGLFLKTSPYAVYKRGGFGDYAQWLEIFGMPQRIGKYSSFDPQSRQLLEEALKKAGSAPWLVVPKETDIETTNNTGNGSSGVSYNDFRKACNEEMLITILGQTLTTVQGDKGARSLGEVHKQVEEGKNKSDMKFVQRILNSNVKPLLLKRGLPVADGNFVFPEAAEQLKVSEIVSLSKIIQIPVSYIHDKYGIPRPKDNEEVAQVKETTSKPIESNEPSKPLEKTEEKIDKKTKNFFVAAPAEIGAFIQTLSKQLIRSITGKIILKGSYSVNIDKLIKRAIFEIYNDETKQNELINKDLFEITNSTLQIGISKELLSINDTEFIKQFRENTAVFAAFKNHLQTKEMVGLLVDENGNLRPFYKFKKLALQLSEKYNINWLQTEYNTAVRAARSAANFKKFQETVDLYPNLEYIESSAAHRRQSHEKYVGTILPIDHPWWVKHMPPSDWNCQCSVRQTDKDITEVPDDELVNPAFENNPGITGQFVKIDETQYFKNTDDPELIKAEAIRIQKEILKEKRKEALESLKKNLNKSVIHQEAGVTIKFTNTGNKEAVNSPFIDLIAKLEALPEILTLIKNSKYIGVAENHKIEKKPHILKYHYFKTKIKEIDAYIVIEQNKRGEYVFYAITDKIQKTTDK